MDINTVKISIYSLIFKTVSKTHIMIIPCSMLPLFTQPLKHQQKKEKHQPLLKQYQETQMENFHFNPTAKGWEPQGTPCGSPLVA